MTKQLAAMLAQRYNELQSCQQESRELSSREERRLMNIQLHGNPNKNGFRGNLSNDEIFVLRQKYLSSLDQHWDK